jgi:hypothetical protein
MPSHYMKEVCIRQDQKTKPACKDQKNITKLKNKLVPKMVWKWVPKIATPAKSVDPKESSEEV